MAKKTQNILLKVLAGLHAGAQTPLQDGIYVIGSGDNCDIVLSDDGVADIHARLVVDKSHVTLEAKAYPIYVDGKATQADAVSLHARHVITIGMAFFTIGTASTPWEEISLPTLEKADSDLATITKTNDNSEHPATLSNGNDMDHGHGETSPLIFPDADLSSPGVGKAQDPPPETPIGTPTGATPPETPIGTPTAQSPPPAHLSQERYFRTICVTLAASATFFVAWPAYQWFFPEPRPVVQHVNVVTDIHHMIAGLGPEFDNVTVAPNQDSDGITIGGYVTDSSHYHHFLEELKKTGIETSDHLRLRINISGSMAEWIRDDLRAQDFHVTVKDLGTGKFEISGIVDRPESIRAAITAIRKQIPHIRNIEEHIISTQHIVDVVNGELDHQGVDGSIVIKGHDAQIEASGFLDEKDFTLWRKIVTALQHMYGSILTVQDRVENVPGLKLPLRSVVKGPHSFVVLNGKGYFREGMQLPNGFRLDTIAQDYLLLSRDGHTYKYVYGGYENG